MEVDKGKQKVWCPELGGWGLAGFCRGELNVAIFFAHINWLLYSRTSKKCVSYTLGYCYYFGAATIGDVGTFPGSHLGARANAKVGEATPPPCMNSTHVRQFGSEDYDVQNDV